MTNGLSTAPAPPKFHVHFGAGKLGLGLVVPAIAATGDPFAVVARPSSAWDGVAASGEGVALSVEIKMFRIRSTWSNSNGFGERDRPDLEISRRDDRRSKNEPKRPCFERDRRVSRFVSPV